VIEARRMWRPLQTLGQGRQAQDRRTAGAEHRLVFVAAGPRQPKAFVKLSFALEVEDFELGRPERPLPRVQYQ
jgi:hypothetical protein